MTAPALLPAPPDLPRPARCRCGRAVPVGPLVDGWATGCARRLGLIPAAAPRIPRPCCDQQDGPDLLDLLAETQH